jgi:cytoskeletal protein CcmA (bactofilin family)
MALFGTTSSGRQAGGPGGDGDHSEAGDGKGAFQPQEPSQVTSPKFQPGMPVKPQTGAFRPEPPAGARADGDHQSAPKSEPMVGEVPASDLGAAVIPGASRGGEEVKNLIVGQGIQLNGQISACDRLVVEGTVEADLNDAEAIEVRENGLFKGTASIEEAIISGRFEGTLIAKRRLIVRNGGRIEGSVQYAALIIEEGGQVRGQMDVYGGG